MTGDQQAVIDFLADPATHGSKAPERRDTHGAIVFLGPERAFKLKRAVQYAYMDFSTVVKRRAACEAEIELNRRTAPDIYLAARSIGRAKDGTLAFDVPDDQALDWVVEMRRFDDHDLLSRWAEQGRLSGAIVDELLDAVRAFHDRQAPAQDAGNWPAHFRWVVTESCEEITGRPALFGRDKAQALDESSRAWLGRLFTALADRAEAGFVRHCHGDLHLGNTVMIDDHPVIFDCLEFDPALARIDVLYDLAFLLMDMQARGEGEFACRALARYLTPGEGLDGMAQMPLFLSARAAIRAKVAASTADALDDAGQREAQERQARSYLDRALDYLEDRPARLAAVGGLSGTGKTAVARRLAPLIGQQPGAVVLRSDVIRKHLAGVAETEQLPQSAYSKAMTTQVFAALAERAAALLDAGYSVIADAVYAKPDQRAALAEVARQAGVPLTGLWLEAGEATRLDRVGGRQSDASDADAAIVRRQSDYDIGTLDWARVSAEGRLDEVVARARAVLGVDGAR